MLTLFLRHGQGISGYRLFLSSPGRISADVIWRKIMKGEEK
jgi:hypothetical protein